MKISNLGRLFRSQKGFNDTFAMISLNRFFDSKLHVWSVLHVNPLGGPPKNRKNAILAKWMYFYSRWLYVKTSFLEGLFRSQKGFNNTFAMISLNRFFDSKLTLWSTLHVNPLGGPPKNRKNAFLAKWTYFYPRWLYVKTSLLEGLFRSQKGFNDTFAMISLNPFFDSNIDSLK